MLPIQQSAGSAGLLQGAGVATSLNATGQQWDAPNAWAPLQSIMVNALLAHGGVLLAPSRPAILSFDSFENWGFECLSAVTYRSQVGKLS